jgi:hypothetical protein
VSLYANDIILFLSPVAADMEMACIIFSVFEGASSLRCNMRKCQIVPIPCEPVHLELATSYFPCTVAEFPMRYLGIPLSVTTMPKIAWQHLIDDMADKLPTWKGSLMHKSGRLALINLHSR